MFEHQPQQHSLLTHEHSDEPQPECHWELVCEDPLVYSAHVRFKNLGDGVSNSYGLGSALFYALFLYYSGTLGTGQPIVLRTTMLTAGGLLFTSIASPAAYTQAFFDPITWPFAIGFAVLGILIPTTLINFASPKLTTGMVSIMASSELPVGIFAAWAIVGDAPSPLVLFGAFLVLAGIVVKQLPSLMKRNAGAPS